jgi:hypothetical protein
MSLLHALWKDETGVILSAELVMLGTLGVVGATVGLHTAAKSVNEEMTDFARTMRSLDQSYSVPGYHSCGAWKAGSHYRQEDVQVSIRKLEIVEDGEHGRHPDRDRARDGKPPYRPRPQIQPKRKRPPVPPRREDQRREDQRRDDERRRTDSVDEPAAELQQTPVTT